MIDKRTLNNEIVTMRKVVKQAKVHIISKLSREIKNLRNKEGPDEMKSKCNQKADRKRDEIFAIKKLNLDDVSKFALKNLEDPVKKIGDQGVNLELRAYFRFAASKVMSARVTAFREQYPDWKDYVHDLLDELGARRKNPNKPVGPAIGKSPAVLNKNPDFKEDKSSVSMQKREETCAKDSNNRINGKLDKSRALPSNAKKSKFLSQWTVEEIEPVAHQFKHVEDVHQKVRFKDVKVEKQSSSVSKVHSVHKGGAQFRSVKKISGIAEVKRFHELCETQESAPREKKQRAMDAGNSDNDDEIADGQAVDPFFVKSDGKTEYVTKMVVEEGDDEDEKGDSPPFARGGKQFRGGQGRNEGGWGARGALGNRGGGQGFRGGRGSFSDQGQPRRGRGGHGGEEPWSERGSKGRDHDSRFSGRSESARGGNKFSQRNQAMPTESGAHLHPSWEAKRKMKEQSISSIAFQGKKIKFDDDD